MTAFNLNRFKQDYLLGRVAEDCFYNWSIRGDNMILFQAPENKPFSDYDFITQYAATKEKKAYGDIELPNPISWEIKADFSKSDNIAIQFYSSSKRQTDNYLPNCSLPCNAGLFKTRANLYCTLNVEEKVFYIAPTHLLQSYLIKTPGIKKLLANRNKPEQTGIALIPKKVWRDNFYYIHYIPEEYTEITE